jgi:2-polyprenyl-3-methyl-5-hydroxy-6-metoxy-1,4-benzoquinol methylase
MTSVESSNQASPSIYCAVCGNDNLQVKVIGGLRRGACSICQHSQRLAFDKYDYTAFAMGATGESAKTLQSQISFLLPYLQPDTRALELGCAAGSLASALRKKHTFARFDGIEFSPAKEKAAQVMDRVFDQSLAQCTSQKVINPKDYDLVILSHVLEHLTEPNVEIEMITQLLAPDGLLFVEVPNLSGHKDLAYDDNRSHLQFFSISSLTRLFARNNLQVFVTSSGNWHDARYPDSLRVLARSYVPFRVENKRLLSDRLDVEKVVVWGAGKMCDEVLAHFFDPSRIEFFVDSDVRKHGSICLGKPIKPLSALVEEPGHVVLINSLEYEDSIKRQIEQEFKSSVSRVIPIAEIL